MSKKGLFKKSTFKSRLTLLALAVAGGFAFWQMAPTTSAEANPAVDDLVVAPTEVPASFADVIEAVKPSVVNISTSMTAGPMTGNGPPHQMPFPPGSPFEDFFRRFFEQQSMRSGANRAPVVQGMGSGFIVDPEGFVVTNNHVIEGAEEITVTLNDGERHPAKLLGSDPKTDLALLKIETDEALPYARLGDSDATRVGDWVIAIGNPFGLGGTATTGIVSARGRDIQSGPFDDFLQIDAPINRGNSGGPLFDLTGRVIGINTAIFSPNGGNVGIGFAIPAKQAEPVLAELRSSGRVERGWLGVQIQAVNEDIAAGLGLDEEHGALVAEVVPDSPAERAGLRSGDVIVGIEGQEVESLKDLTRAVADVQPGEKAEIEVWRNGKRESLGVVIGESPEQVATARSSNLEDSPAVGRLGLTLGELTPESRQRYRVDSDLQGALVTGVEPGSAAAQTGLRTGDVLVMVGQTPVSGPAEAVREIEEVISSERDRVVLQVARGEGRRFVVVPVA
jgi:serine protease Do